MAPADPVDRLQRRAGNQALQRLVEENDRSGGPSNGGNGRQPETDRLAGLLDRSRGRPLDVDRRRSMERRFGSSFGGVRVHDGTAARTTAREMGAVGVTVGSDVVLDTSQVDPSSIAGTVLLAHELAHVRQFDGTSDESDGTTVPAPDSPMEREARDTAARSLTGDVGTISARPTAPVAMADQLSFFDYVEELVGDASEAPSGSAGGSSAGGSAPGGGFSTLSGMSSYSSLFSKTGSSTPSSGGMSTMSGMSTHPSLLLAAARSGDATDQLSRRQLHANWRYGTQVPNRSQLGQNVQRDHVKQVAVTRAQRRAPDGTEYYDRNFSRSYGEMTVLEETGTGKPHTVKSNLEQTRMLTPFEEGTLKSEGAIMSRAQEIAAETQSRSGGYDRMSVDLALIDNQNAMHASGPDVETPDSGQRSLRQTRVELDRHVGSSEQIESGIDEQLRALEEDGLQSRSTRPTQRGGGRSTSGGTAGGGGAGSGGSSWGGRIVRGLGSGLNALGPIGDILQAKEWSETSEQGYIDVDPTGFGLGPQIRFINDFDRYWKYQSNTIRPGEPRVDFYDDPYAL